MSASIVLKIEELFSDGGNSARFSLNALIWADRSVSTAAVSAAPELPEVTAVMKHRSCSTSRFRFLP